MTEPASFDEMSPEERMAVLAKLSQCLHHSALLARQQGDAAWVTMEALANRLMTEACDLVTSEKSAAARDIFAEAVRLMSKFEHGSISPTRTVH